MLFRSKASAQDLSGCTADSVKAFHAALTAAKAVASDGKATQNEVDNAVERLLAAQAGLTKAPAVEAPVVSPSTDAPIQNAGDGSTPTKTGDAGVCSLMALTVLAGAAMILLKKKTH